MPWTPPESRRNTIDVLNRIAANLKDAENAAAVNSVLGAVFPVPTRVSSGEIFGAIEGLGARICAAMEAVMQFPDPKQLPYGVNVEAAVSAQAGGSRQTDELVESIEDAMHVAATHLGYSALQIRAGACNFLQTHALHLLAQMGKLEPARIPSVHWAMFRHAAESFPDMPEWDPQWLALGREVVAEDRELWRPEHALRVAGQLLIRVTGFETETRYWLRNAAHGAYALVTEAFRRNYQLAYNDEPPLASEAIQWGYKARLPRSPDSWMSKAYQKLNRTFHVRGEEETIAALSGFASFLWGLCDSLMSIDYIQPSQVFTYLRQQNWAEYADNTSRYEGICAQPRSPLPIEFSKLRELRFP